MATLEFQVDAALLVNEGGVQCTPIVFARPLGDVRFPPQGDWRLKGSRVAGLDPARAHQRGPGLVAFVLEDPMDVRWFRPGEVIQLDTQ